MSTNYTNITSGFVLRNLEVQISWHMYMYKTNRIIWHRLSGYEFVLCVFYLFSVYPIESDNFFTKQYITDF